MKRIYSKYVLKTAFRIKDTDMGQTEIYDYVCNTLMIRIILPLMISLSSAIYSAVYIFYFDEAFLSILIILIPLPFVAIQWSFGRLGRDVFKAYIRFRDLEGKTTYEY